MKAPRQGRGGAEDGRDRRLFVSMSSLGATAGKRASDQILSNTVPTYQLAKQRCTRAYATYHEAHRAYP